MEKEIFDDILEDIVAEEERRESTETDAASEATKSETDGKETNQSETFQSEGTDTIMEEETEDRRSTKKKLKFDKKQDKMKEKVDELEDRVKRQMAEFDNFRKRTEKEKSTMFESGARSIIEKILPIADNFERGLQAVPDDEACKSFADGMKMIYKQMITALEEMGVKAIPAVGEEFNPDFHNAVMQVENEEFSENTIVQELQKGYTYRDTVIRYSMVSVAK